MATALAHCVSCYGLPTNMNRLSLTNNWPNASFKSLSFSSTNSCTSVFTKGFASMCPLKMGSGSNRRSLIVRAEEKSKKPDSAAKRARQSEKRRVYNKARKSEVRTR